MSLASWQIVNLRWLDGDEKAMINTGRMTDSLAGLLGNLISHRATANDPHKQPKTCIATHDVQVLRRPRS